MAKEEYDERRTVKRVIKGVAGGIVGLAALVLGGRSCTCVDSGHVAVQSVMGEVQEEVLTEGINFPVNPFASRTEMSIRTQEIKERMQTPTSEGLLPTLEVSALYKLQPNRASEVYQTIGENYDEVIVQPGLRNAVRDVVAGYTSADLYSPNRGRIEQAIFEKLKAFYEGRGITLEKVLLRDLVLPPQLVSAIEGKMQEQQKAEQMTYTLQRERQEAERKAVEAGGIAEAQKIIAESLTPEYLQWRYITTLEGLAGSPNNTFVITPYGQELVPMLNVDND